jgi:phosphomannomutase
MTVSSELLRRAREWATHDPDPVTRAELTSLIEAAGDDEVAAADLAARFAGTLEFGTAGLRGPLGGGPMRMNRVVVTRAAAGLAAYLLDHGARSGDAVVIGYDARHNSETFARDTAEVVTGVGLRALLLPRPLPTPLVPFAIRHLGCTAGVMVTASHNPPQDNGYKVYLGDGCQIVSPADTEIAARIDAVGLQTVVPRGGPGEVLGEEVVEAYLDAVSALPAPGARDLSWVYTPMHGVGGATAVAASTRAGFRPPAVVTQQADPDPEFPTVAFPNPEEPGAMDLAMDLAAGKQADVLIANDPDADRCAVGVPTGEGRWRMLRGDEVGTLLGDHLLRQGTTGVFAASIVSSSLLGRLATVAGQPYEETLTGFKWIGRVPGLVFGYEEALGYCVAPHLVRDKDGVSTLVLVLELAASLKAEGRTLLDRLDEIALQHGLHATDQLSLRVTDLARIRAAMARLRATPPTTLGGLEVEHVDDLAAGGAGLPPTEGLRLRLAGRARVVVRPSGTEPKLKCYLEVVVPVGDDQAPTEALGAARIVAVQRLDAIRADLAAVLALPAP